MGKVTGIGIILGQSTVRLNLFFNFSVFRYLLVCATRLIKFLFTLLWFDKTPNVTSITFSPFFFFN